MVTVDRPRVVFGGLDSGLGWLRFDVLDFRDCHCHGVHLPVFQVLVVVARLFLYYSMAAASHGFLRSFQDHLCALLGHFSLSLHGYVSLFVSSRRASAVERGSIRRGF